VHGSGGILPLVHEQERASSSSFCGTGNNDDNEDTMRFDAIRYGATSQTPKSTRNAAAAASTSDDDSSNSSNAGTFRHLLARSVASISFSGFGPPPGFGPPGGAPSKGGKNDNNNNRKSNNAAKESKSRQRQQQKEPTGAPDASVDAVVGLALPPGCHIHGPCPLPSVEPLLTCKIT
jgi:hypothetical protein